MNHTQTWRVLALTGYFALFALLMTWNAWLAPSRYFPVAMVLLVMGTPLLFPLRGLLHGKPYTHAWTSYLALAYFTHGVGTAWAVPAERLYGWLEIVFSLMLFVGAIFYARFRGRELRLAAETAARQADTAETKSPQADLRES